MKFNSIMNPEMGWQKYISEFGCPYTIRPPEFSEFKALNFFSEISKVRAKNIFGLQSEMSNIKFELKVFFMNWFDGKFSEKMLKRCLQNIEQILKFPLKNGVS